VRGDGAEQPAAAAATHLEASRLVESLAAREPVALSVPPELDSLKSAPRVTAPAIFVLAGRDTIVPPQYQEQVFAAYGGPKRAIRVADIDHNDPLPDKDLKTLAAARDELWKQAFGGKTTTQPTVRARE
jgi:fermentation-respiration switch protein FrsA (DUF1100 family)